MKNCCPLQEFAFVPSFCLINKLSGKHNMDVWYWFIWNRCSYLLIQCYFQGSAQIGDWRYLWLWKITAVGLQCIGINRMGERSKGWNMHHNTISLSYILVFDVGTQVRKAGGCIVTSHHTPHGSFHHLSLLYCRGQTLDQGHLQTVPTFRTSNAQTSHTYEWPSITKMVDIVLLPQANKANEATQYFHDVLIYNLFSALFNGSWKYCVASAVHAWWTCKKARTFWVQIYTKIWRISKN